MNDEERIAKLPLWARDEIAKLRADVRHSAAVPGESNVAMVEYSFLGGEISLPKNSRVLFRLPDGEIEVAHAGASDPAGVLRISSSRVSLVVFPAASNVIHVKGIGR